MKNIIKRFSAVALVIIILLTFCGFTNAYNPKAYDINNILKTIREITSKEFNGRAAGTPDGKKTEDYFAAKFKEIGLKPGGDKGTYSQGFNGVRGESVGPYLLEVVDGSKVIKTYKYGTDYKFLTRCANSGDVTAIGKAVEEASGNMPKASGEIALLSVYDIPIGQTPQPLIDLYNAGYRGAIVPGGDTLNRVKGQKGFFDDTNASKLPRVTVSNSVFGELMDYSNKGYKIHLKTNFVASRYSANNVIGVLEAAKPTQDCLIISGHMDHVAPDPDGAYFPGALDNASGSSSIVEIARALKKQNIKPSINIVFIAFNGEEIALHGSKKYVSAPLYPLQNSKNINLDGLGGKRKSPESPMYIGASSYSSKDEKTTELIDEIINVIKDQKYDYIVGRGDDTADHTSFAQAGVPAVSLMDGDDDGFYHVPEDTIDNIGVDNLKRDVDIVMSLIGKLAYTDVSAIPTASKVLINGKPISFEAYNIDDSNYFKLRDLAMAVNGTKKQFEVGYDGTKNAINLTTNKVYTPTGGELTLSAKPTAKEAKPTTSKVYMNGKEVKFTAYNIGGSNYFKLRDIAKVIDFGVTYDGKTNTIGIDTSISYTE